MRILTLKRLVDIPTQGYFGVLFDDKDPFVVTLERNWEDNQHDISCIPTGEYISRYRPNLPHYGNTYEVTNVPNRTDILIHKGNYMRDSKGCILLGNYFDRLKDVLMVADSGTAYTKFMNRLDGEMEFKLVIQNVPWEPRDQ